MLKEPINTAEFDPLRDQPVTPEEVELAIDVAKGAQLAEDDNDGKPVELPATRE